MIITGIETIPLKSLYAGSAIGRVRLRRVGSPAVDSLFVAVCRV
jgi:hypothetical protein